MADQPIDVAFCFDDHLALPGAAALLSLIDTNPAVCVHILTDPRPDAAPLLRSIAAARGVDLAIIDRAPERAHGVGRESDYGRSSTATYRRAFLADLIPGLDRILYLDADLIVRASLSDLWSTDLTGAALGAVVDPWMATIGAMSAAFPDGYFNAGVLLIDLAKWRDEQVSARFVDDIRRRRRSGEDPRAHSHDQTPLNEVLRGRWRALSPRWNFTTHLTPRLAGELAIPASDYAAMAADPAIVHFLGSHKPWVPGFENLTLWHAEFQTLRRRLESDFDLAGLAWPSSFTNGDAAARKRRMLALRLVHEAHKQGLDRPAIILTGLLGREVLTVAREQDMPIACFASENPVHSGGRLHDVEVVTIGEAIDGGQRDFIIGDYRRLARTRETVDCEAKKRGAELRVAALSPPCG